jgi:2-hydroxychromene-2-carboxylate isomerase
VEIMSDKTVFYYLSPQSPWSYLGHLRFIEIAERHDVAIRVRPIDLGRVFPASGGVPLAKRPPQRQAYRLAELDRWSAHLKMPLNTQPKFFPVPGDLPPRVIIAALNEGVQVALRLTWALMRAVWAEQRDISEPDTMRDIVAAQGLAADALLHRADAAAIADTYDRYTQEAIDRGVFGVPTYAYRDELFWGQDRLDFLDRALAKD